ncbi:hypothetical protein RRG08_026893 [Elysia crispata]|uniref:Uncharacterized protein n=1 Tax=Elysia crispata TaxID=231223 RepID=A0AAE1DWE0_9GAST|nr:hypothetical protein RRG08_026893 [Elysia crispata]
MILPYQLQKPLATLITGQDGLDDLALSATETRRSADDSYRNKARRCRQLQKQGAALMTGQDGLDDLALSATETISDADDRSGWTR